MNRRLFVGQVAAGLALLSAPLPLMAHSLPQANPSLPVAPVKSAAEWIQNGRLGTPQYLTISHVYSPDHTSVQTLMALVQRDIELAHQLLSANSGINSQALFRRSSSEFGTYAAQFDLDGIPVTWQGLARVGGEAREPVAQIRLYGSNGMLQSARGQNDYQLVDFQGRVTPISA